MTPGKIHFLSLPNLATDEVEVLDDPWNIEVPEEVRNLSTADYKRRWRDPTVHHWLLLLVEGREVGGAGYVGADGAGEVIDAERCAVLRYRGAENGDSRGCGGGCLNCRSCVRHDEVDVVGNKAVYDDGAVCGLAGGVLIVKGDLVAELFLQSVHKALSCGVKSRVLSELNDAYAIGLFSGRCGAGGKSKDHRESKNKTKYLFHIK